MRIGEWMAEYEKQLLAVVLAEQIKPASARAYAFGPGLVPTVSDRMKVAFQAKTYNKDGLAIKRTCKAFGIPYTYTAINNFIAGVKA